MSRDTITAAQLGTLPPGTPVTVIGSRQHYGIAIGPAEHTRWLSSQHGIFRTFRTADAAAALLHAHGIRRFTLDLNGGIPQ